MKTWKSYAAAILSLLMLPASLYGDGSHGSSAVRSADGAVPALALPASLAAAPGLAPGGGAGAGTIVPADAEPLLHDAAVRRRRLPWVATLCVGGATLVAGAVLGGLALDRARGFELALAAGADGAQLLGLRGEARQLAFATDLLLASAALMGAVTLVLRFGTAPSRRPEPADLERAYQVPGEGER